MANIVEYHKDKGPIVLEVTSGFACVGSFLLLLFKNGEVEEMFPDRSKSISDNIPDIFSTSLQTLKDSTLTIVGKYAPAPSHNQIFVKYEFFQLEKDDPEADLAKLKISPVDGGIIQELSDIMIKRRNVFTFQPI
ncbi:hypothetical protein HNV11_14930 [Spirosoma taeanense]|uniref:Uncharacterized protein n=1 Tax=Spirosoma taeanense TaxID=2735870 RepID=A0A6M5YBE4_9BACT|nr:hypothetical protein [Spirosoma taeanense]QJW90583.1 hypothetical protein HNV11_14930 [Spirosoma taeanense]